MKGPIPQINIASREIVTRYQIDACLAAMGMAGSLLGHYMHSPDDPAADKFTPVNSEAKIALENTLIAACARLDGVLNDKARWGMEFQSEVEKNYMTAQEMQTQLMQQQKLILDKQQRAAEEITSPHFRYRPTLFRMKDGSWCAFLGDINFMDLGVIGVGNCAQDAIEAFDDAFRGVTNKKVLEWAKQREKNLETGAQDAPFPNEPKDTNEQSQTLDGPGEENPSETLGEWNNIEGAGGETGPQRGFGERTTPPFKHREGGFLNKLRRLFGRGD